MERLATTYTRNMSMVELAMTYSDPNANKGPTIIAATAITTGCALVLVLMRVYVRLAIIKNFGIDDILICVAMSLNVLDFALIIPEVQHGAGKHVTELSHDENVLGLKYNFVTQCLVIWVSAIVKFSIGFFLIRLSPNKTYRFGLIGLIVFLFCYTVACFLTIVLQCRPIEKTWDATLPGTCFSAGTLQGLSYFNSVVSILTDFTLAALPVPMLFQVQINKRTKIAIMVILGLGFFAAAASIVKAVYVSHYGLTGDFLFDSTELTIWTSTEGNVGIVAACIPSLKPLFKKVLSTGQYYSSGARRKGQSRTPYEASGYIKQASFHGTRVEADESYAMHNMASKNQVSVHVMGKNGGSRRVNNLTSNVGRDDDSEEYILSKEPATVDHGIMKTTEVRVVQEAIDNDSSSEDRTRINGSKTPNNNWYSNDGRQ